MLLVCLILKGGSVVPFVTLVSQEEHYAFLMLSQEKYLYFKEKFKKIYGSICINDVIFSCF